jgi:hypothetical protein
MTETGDPGPRMNDPPPPRPESPIQTVQGWYYLIAGLAVALGIATLQSVTGPRVDLPNLWIARVFGVVVACIGVGLIIAAKRTERVRAAIGGPMLLAAVLALINVIGMANGALPMTFLIDLAMEIGFITWWAFELYVTATPYEAGAVRANAQTVQYHR